MSPLVDRNSLTQKQEPMDYKTGLALSESLLKLGEHDLLYMYKEKKNNFMFNAIYLELLKESKGATIRYPGEG